MKTLENILETAAAEMDGARKVISRMVADSESEGIEWPELEEEPEHGICSNCAGTGCYNCHYSGEV
jgi:hypothetical protein